MSTRALEYFFDPKSIAVVGASDRQGSMGGAVIKNLIQSKYSGALYPVNLKRYRSVMGLKAFHRLSRLPQPVDLVVICTPESQVTMLLKECERLSIRAALILTGGFSRNTSLFSQAERLKTRKKAKHQMNLRVIGPDCYGIIVPHRNLNISYSPRKTFYGNLAYIGQSGSLASAMLDWANERKIGFRYFMTLGDGLDINLADLIDYLAQDHRLAAILLQLEYIPEPARLARAIRVCSKRQLVVYVKTKHGVELGLPPEYPPAGIPDRDQVHNVVLRRAGSIRVSRLESLFEAAEILGYGLVIQDLPLIILTNGLGAARLALDHLLSVGGKVHQFTANEKANIKQLIGREAGQSPHVIDLGYGATGQEFTDCTEYLQKHKVAYPILIIYSPNDPKDSNEIAQSLINIHLKNRTLLTCWLGGEVTPGARQQLERKGIPCLNTPERAIDVFMLLVNHKRTQHLLKQTPQLHQIDSFKQLELDECIKHALDKGRSYFTSKEAFEFLRKLRMPVLNTAFADSIETLAQLKLDKLEKQPIALKIIHAHGCKPFAYGENPRERWRGVVLPIKNRIELMDAAKRLQQELSVEHPESQLHGFSVQPLRSIQEGIQLSIGVTKDNAYGPLIFFGSGGSAANIIADRKIELPALNTSSALSLIKRTHADKVLKERCLNYPHALNVIVDVLIKISRMVETCHNIKNCELNVFLNTNSLRLQIMGQAIELQSKAFELCFPSPPLHLSESLTMRSGRSLYIRPIMAEDEPKLRNFHDKLSDNSLKNRFFVLRRNLSHDDFAKLTQIDYVREMAFLGLVEEESQLNIAGVVRCFIDPDAIQAEYSLVIRDDLQKLGIGSLLLTKMIDYLTLRGVMTLKGDILLTNKPMIRLARKLGFMCEFSNKDHVAISRLMLNHAREEWQSKRIEEDFS